MATKKKAAAKPADAKKKAVELNKVNHTALQHTIEIELLVDKYIKLNREIAAIPSQLKKLVAASGKTLKIAAKVEVETAEIFANLDTSTENGKMVMKYYTDIREASNNFWNFKNQVQEKMMNMDNPNYKPKPAPKKAAKKK